ncbi:MAG: hypothetical protein PSV40_02070 [Polaromonas sp.]|uniref:hypothetical protein n=1 Tax=Polaromonas sp. TaxID=1869339 RepID=UPI00248A8002|nr:hypothetical protein [Polaromonas sp.]MDI1267875.1 hypothetical protein [Polaromonas sp.]
MNNFMSKLDDVVVGGAFVLAPEDIGLDPSGFNDWARTHLVNGGGTTQTGRRFKLSMPHEESESGFRCIDRVVVTREE